jgi:glycosyltransferase involved in cell wall biosynthesis
MRETLRICVIVPFLNEERHLGRLLESVAAQRRPPDLLVLVDDGSDDRSPQIGAEFAARHPYARVIRRPPRDVGRDRLAGGAAVRAFAWAVGQVSEPWDVVAKVDADLELNPATLEALERELLADPSLGMVGAYLSAAGEDGSLRRQRCRPEHVEGETKFYRRECYEAIAPLPAMLGWDTIDEVRARLLGWRTRSIEIPGGDPVHLREMGAHDGLLRGYRRWGACAYAYGEHPLHVLAVAVQRAGDRPRLLGGVNYMLGWAAAAAGRAPRAEPAVRAAVAEDGLRRVLVRLGVTAPAKVAPR